MHTEFGVLWSTGHIDQPYATIEKANLMAEVHASFLMEPKCKIVSREVSEWEEVDK